MSTPADSQIAAADQNAATVNIGSAGPTDPSNPQAVPPNPAFPPIVPPPLTGYGTIRERVSGIPATQKIILLAALVFVLILVVGLSVSGKSKDDYRVLFSNVNERDGAAIVAALQQMNVPYRFTEGGGALMVPDAVVHETRLKLAGQGLPKAGSVGFELLENQKLGTSQFLEHVNYQRGLEGELAKSIGSIGQVKAARVHLAVPKQTAFVREQEKPSASVVLTLYPGRFLDPQQAVAITHLVSSSIPNLSPQSVTIVDSEGNMLAPNPQRTMGGMDANQLKYVAELEGALSKRINTILEPVAGRDNVRAQVTLDMDFAELERMEENYGRNSPPNASSIRSQQSLESTAANQAQGGVPGALTNQPPPNAQAPIDGVAAGAGADQARVLNSPPGATTTGTTNRKEQTVNYEVDRSIQRLKRVQGSVKRVSAAVVVNYKSSVDPKTGKTKVTPFSAKELEQFNALAPDAIGFNEQRGDSVSVANIPFSAEAAAETTPFYAQPGIIEIVKEFFKFAVIIGALAVVFMAVVKPILFPPHHKEEEDDQSIEDEFDEKVKAELQSMSPQAREKRRIEIELQREKLRLQEEEARLHMEEEKRLAEERKARLAQEMAAEYEELLAHAKEFVEREPRIVAGVFKDWMAADNKPKDTPPAA